MVLIVIVWIILLILMLLKYGYYGFAYFPILDDWIQYGGYILYDNIFTDVILGRGTCTTRPLASLSDPYIWGAFWNNMKPAFIIITMLHLLSIYFIYKIFKNNNINVKMPFLIICGLIPLGTEATYWISASSRLVVGMFFASLSLYFLSLYFVKQPKKRIYLLLFSIINIISMGYYEQIAILSFFTAILIFYVNRDKVTAKWHFVLPFVSILIIGMYYIFFSGGGGGASRAEFAKGNILEHIGLVFREIKNVWIVKHFPLYTNGFRRGISVLISNKSYLYLLLIILASIITAIIYGYADNQHKPRRILTRIHSRSKILPGILLFIIPIIPNAILDTVWICNRNAFPSIIGFALIIDGLLELIPQRTWWRRIKPLIVFSVIFIFLIVNVSEITDYKTVSEIDRKIAEGILGEIQSPRFYYGETKALVFNTKTSYIEQNSYYRDHIHNVTSSDWALTGAVRAVAKNTDIQYITPVSNNSIINIDVNEWKHYILLGITKNLEIVSLGHKQINNNEYELITGDDEVFGRVTVDEEQIHFTNIN